MKDINDNGTGGDHELIRLSDVVRCGKGEHLRLDKIIEKAMLNPSPEMEIDSLHAKRDKLTEAIAETRRDFEVLKASKLDLLAAGEKGNENELEGVDSQIQLLQKRIDQYDAMRIIISKMVNEVRRRVLEEAKRGVRQFKSEKTKEAKRGMRQFDPEKLTQIKQRLDANDERIFEIANQLGLTDEELNSLASARKPSLKERTINTLKGFFGMFVGSVPAEDEAGESDSGSENPACPHCGVPAKHADSFCVECGKSLSQDKD